MRKININFLLVGSLLLFILISCSNNTSNVPILQVEFEKARNVFYESYDNAPNEIKKSAIFIQSGQHTCEFEKKHGISFIDWIGVIDKITTDQGGNEIEYFKITSKSQGRTISYIASDIKKGSPLYNQIAEFKEGDNICFSFKFKEETSSANEKGCFEELSITELGSLDEPEFGVSVSNIKKSE